MTLPGFIFKFIGVVACALFAAAFASDSAKTYKTDDFSKFGGALILTVCFLTGLIKIIWM